MHKYRVVECWLDESRLTLQCTRGHFHVVRALSMLPVAGASLEGAKPHLGFGILLCPISGTIFRVIFESIGNPTKPPAPNATAGTENKLHSASDGKPRGAV